MECLPLDGFQILYPILLFLSLFFSQLHQKTEDRPEYAPLARLHAHSMRAPAAGTDTVGQLDLWLDRAVTATTAADLFE